MNTFEEITDASLHLQLTRCELRIRQHLLYKNWPAIKVDADYAAEMDAELRRRHNLTRKPLARMGGAL